MVLVKIVIALYIVKQKKENFLNEKNVKITKGSHAYKGYTSTYSVKTFHSFNPQLQHKDTEFAIKNKLIDLLPKLKRFKFLTLVLEFKKCKMMMKNYIAPFIRTHKQKQLLMKVTLMMYLNQSIVVLYQTYKNL